MPYLPGQIYHVYNQGNNRQPIFFKDKNYWYFLDKMRYHLLPFADLICYCLMPNHFHWLLVPKPQGCRPGNAVRPQRWLENNEAKICYQQNLSQAIGKLLSSYTRGINEQEKRSGSLFRNKTKAKDGWVDGPVSVNGKNRKLFFRYDNDYALQCFHYIHQNPVKAGYVNHPTDWAFSSAKTYYENRPDELCNARLGKTLIYPAEQFTY